MGVADQVAELAGELADLRSDVSYLIESLSVSALGIGLLQNPIGFVKAVSVELFIDTALRGGGLLGKLLGDRWTAAAGALTGAGGAVGDAFGSIGGGLLDVVDGINGVAVSIASSAGPLAPVVVVILWAGVGIALAYGALLTLEAIKWLT
jgi:hypothetical protein